MSYSIIESHGIMVSGTNEQLIELAHILMESETECVLASKEEFKDLGKAIADKLCGE